LSVVAAVAVAIVLRHIAGKPVLLPDSSSYVRFKPIRTAGYPLVIQLISLNYIVIFQTLLYAAGATALATTVYRRTRSTAFALLLFAGLFANPQFNAFHAQVLTESIGASLLCVIMALIISYEAKAEMRWLAAAGVVAGIATAIKPALAPLILLPSFVLGLLSNAQPRRIWLTAILLLPLAGGSVVGAERLYARSVHGDQLTSLAGPHLFAKAALIDAGPVDTTELSAQAGALTVEAENRYRPIRSILRAARGTSAFLPLLTSYENCIQYPCTAPLRAQSGLSVARFNAELLSAARARISGNPGGYLALSLNEYAALWSINGRTYPPRAAAYDVFVATHAPLPFVAEAGAELAAPTTPSRAALVTRPLFILLGILSTGLFLFSPLLMRRKGAMLFLAVISSWMTVSVFALIALTAIGIGRYAVSMWPTIAVTGLATAWILARSGVATMRSLLVRTGGDEMP
jgi:hypothetical protein